ncbi:hypothetical protein D1AOALGA4SA_2662 [Olavius algarvensis Delta 1 endosymbiont]|nr:hypothetical protein D1AOALGA4SA_2662 [Olavius algarvensis Delta 1 endosymbiont]
MRGSFISVFSLIKGICITVEVTSRQSDLRACNDFYAKPHSFPGLVH